MRGGVSCLKGLLKENKDDGCLGRECIVVCFPGVSCLNGLPMERRDGGAVCLKCVPASLKESGLCVSWGDEQSQCKEGSKDEDGGVVSLRGEVFDPTNRGGSLELCLKEGEELFKGNDNGGESFRKEREVWGVLVWGWGPCSPAVVVFVVFAVVAAAGAGSSSSSSSPSSSSPSCRMVACKEMASSNNCLAFFLSSRSRIFTPPRRLLRAFFFFGRPAKVLKRMSLLGEYSRLQSEYEVVLQTSVLFLDCGSGFSNT